MFSSNQNSDSNPFTTGNIAARRAEALKATEAAQAAMLQRVVDGEANRKASRPANSDLGHRADWKSLIDLSGVSLG